MKNIILLFLILLLAIVLPAQTARNKCVSGNCTNGYGEYVWKTGDRYEGYWKNGKKHGWGTYFYSSGNFYSGNWKEDQKHYFGTLYWDQGDFFYGLFKNGERQKNGVYVWKSGTFQVRTEKVYYTERGYVLGDCKNGYGVYIWKDGNLYAGNWKNGKQHSFGNYFSKDGSFFMGFYKDGRRQEMGFAGLKGNKYRISNKPVSYSPNSFLLGTWNSGYGVYRWKNGDMYAGNWRGKKFNSFGAKVWKEGDFFIGLYKNGKRQKRGLYVWKNRKHAMHTQEVSFYKPNSSYAANVPPKKYNPPVKIQPTKPIRTNPVSSNPVYSAKVKVWAVIVGVADYNHLKPLRYTDDDAYKFAMFLKSPEGGALPDEQISLFIDESASKNSILYGMRRLFSKADSNDVILFYFSGHGKKGAFMPHDYNGFGNQLYHSDVQQILRGSKAKYKLCIADACHSGSLERSEKDPAATNALSNYYQAWGQSSGGIALLMSSKAEETSLETRGKRQGIFSYYLIRGLKGEADGNRNKIITINELYSYVQQNVKNFTRNRQHPVLKGNFDKNMPVGVVR
ncbi:MAG: hypothetical protein GY940_08295 [bacterium]|nr:hypothetical protein [bacterium]